MFTRTHTGLLTLVAATVLTTLAASAPARAEEPVEYLGPVGPISRSWHRSATSE